MKAIKLAAVLVTLLAMPAVAETNGTLRIGVLNDMSSVYADFQGPGSVVAAQMAVEDFAKQSKRKVEVTSGDHQNKPDIGAGIVRPAKRSRPRAEYRAGSGGHQRVLLGHERSDPRLVETLSGPAPEENDAEFICTPACTPRCCTISRPSTKSARRWTAARLSRP